MLVILYVILYFYHMHFQYAQSQYEKLATVLHEIDNCFLKIVEHSIFNSWILAPRFMLPWHKLNWNVNTLSPHDSCSNLKSGKIHEMPSTSYFCFNSSCSWYSWSKKDEEDHSSAGARGKEPTNVSGEIFCFYNYFLIQVLFIQWYVLNMFDVGCV